MDPEHGISGYYATDKNIFQAAGQEVISIVTGPHFVIDI